MIKERIKKDFLDSLCAIQIQNEKELEEFKIFLGASNLFTKDGKIASQIHCIDYPVIFYMNATGVPKYLDTAAREYLEKYMYRVYDYGEIVEPDQMNFFGDDTAPMIRQPDKSLLNDDPMSDGPIDADVKVVENELSLDEIFSHVVVGNIAPARCDGELLEYKDLMIERVKKYENIVVTQDNYKELKTEISSKFNEKITKLKADRARFNKEVKQFTEPYSKAFTEIINAIEAVKESLNENIKVFEDEEADRAKKKLYDETINPTLDIMIKNGIIDEKTREKFTFNDRWTNKSARTSTGNLTKKTTDEINAELNRLAEMYAQGMKDIETIRSTVENLAIAHGVDKEALKADTYVDLYRSGFDMPQIQQKINSDLDNIKKAIEREKEKARIEAERKQREALQSQTVQQAQNTIAEENTVENASQKEIQTLIDEKTGEVVAFAKDKKISVKRIATPEQLKDKTYTYIYEFSGDFGAIKTFSNMLKILSQVSNFKYTRK